MKAAVLMKLNAPLEVCELTIPPLNYGQVLVRLVMSTICGAQIGEITGAKGHDPYLPHLLGHEGVGTVIDVGLGVSHVRAGDRVVLHWRRGVGLEGPFPHYVSNGCIVGGGFVTTFSEQAIVSENRVTKIPDDVPFKVATLMGCAVTTAFGLINNEAQLKIGQSIAIAGVGGVGLAIVHAASLVAANPVIAIDQDLSKVTKALDLGATHYVYNGMNQTRPLTELIRSIVGKQGVDVFVDCTGNVDVIAAGYDTVAAGGRAIMVAQPHCSSDLVLPKIRRNFSGKTLIDSQGGLANPTVDIPRYLALHREGRLKLEEMVTDVFSLDNINEAIDLVRSGKAGRVALEMS